MALLKNILVVGGAAVFLLVFSHKPELIGPYKNRIADTSTSHPQRVFVFEDTVKVGNYFYVMDRIINRYDSLLSHPITEHLMVRYNPWVIDSLAATDYYVLKEKGIISLNPKEHIIFKPGDTLAIPDSAAVDSLNRIFEQTWLDINIPEFKLWVRRQDRTVYTFPVRVGRNERKYLAMAGRVVDLRTRTGEGTIVGYSKNPVFINPSDNKIYHLTHRDDDVITGLPNIPWLIPEINGVRYGQLIHPTTNIKTLGRAYSNGCIGTSEAAAWYIYYYAPIGTRIVIRYDLDVTDENGNTVHLNNIYNR